MKKIILFIVAFTMIFTLSSCKKDDANAKEKIPVRIACFPNITHSQALVGMSTGSFEKALGSDCNVKWQTFNAGPSEIEAIFAGEVDIGYIGPIPAINGYAKSAGDIKIIAGATNAGAVLVTRRDLVLKTLEDLSGLKVAVPQYGNTQDLLLRDLLSSVGLSDKNAGGTVEILASENPNTKLLLDRGDIDAAFVPEPWGTRLIDEVDANILLDYNQMYDGGNYTTAVVIVNNDFLKNHPDKVELFLREHVRLTDYINENKDEAINTVNLQIESITGSKLSDDVIKTAYKRLFVTTDPAEKSVVTFTKAYKDLGYLTTDVNFDNLVDTTILKKILAE